MSKKSSSRIPLRSSAVGPASLPPRRVLPTPPSVLPPAALAAATVSGGRAGRLAGLTSERARGAMIGRLEQAGIVHPLVLAAMAATPRHHYVDSGLASHAYSDDALPIGHGQTISQPYMVAYMASLLFAHSPLVAGKLGRVLEIGTGCGYQAHVLSQLAAIVYSIERVEALYQLSRRNVATFRLPNLRLVWGDGYLGIPPQLDPHAAPFDAIILAAACEVVPPALQAQLKVGGCLVAPVGKGQAQTLEIWKRQGADWQVLRDNRCYFVPMLRQVSQTVARG